MNDVQRMSRKELEDILTGAGETETKALQSLVNIMTSPLARRAGLHMSKEDTAEWAEEINGVIGRLREILDLTSVRTNDLDACDGMIERTRRIIKELI